jgi:hypothetical protein
MLPLGGESSCTCFPRGRGAMIPIMSVGSESLMLGPHWFMLLCTFAIVIGLSVVIYGVVLDDRADVRNSALGLL